MAKKIGVLLKMPQQRIYAPLAGSYTKSSKPPYKLRMILRKINRLDISETSRTANRRIKRPIQATNDVGQYLGLGFE